jgi:carboxyl-terminal processing protease
MSIVAFAESPEEKSPSIDKTRSYLQEIIGSRIKTSDLNRAAIQGMLSHVDQITGLGDSKVLTVAEKDAYLSHQLGIRKGYGISVRIMNKRGLVIKRVLSDRAYHAGLIPEDLIVAINNHPFTGRSASEMLNILHQPHPKDVPFDIIRNEELYRINVEHGEFQISNVTKTSKAIKIHFFGRGSSADLAAILQNHSGGRIIIDLRDNLGGVLEEAVAAAGLFMGRNSIVGYRRFSSGKVMELISSQDQIVNQKISLLINGGTTGAAEMFAAALQSSQKAILIGDSSFGDGADIQFYPLGSALYLKLADIELLSPTKKSWNSLGIEPDIKVQSPVSYPSGEGSIIDVQLETAIQLGKGKIP